MINTRFWKSKLPELKMAGASKAPATANPLIWRNFLRHMASRVFHRLCAVCIALFVGDHQRRAGRRSGNGQCR
jgi:hypothetical protein